MPTRRRFLVQAGAAALLAATSVARAKAKLDPRAPGTVQTVLGPIDAADLGVTLPHEHVCVSSTGFWQIWPEYFGGRATFIAKAAAKLKQAKFEGVDSIVDVTPADIGRDVRLLAEISRQSGVHIVTCTGHWLNPSQSMAARTTEELSEFFLLEIRRGIDGSGIRPGVIKVATDHEGVTPFLEKALRAAARASKAGGVPVTTHTYAADRIGEKQADIFESEGLDPRRVCLGHCDDSDDLEYLTGLARRGYTIGMDHMTWGSDGMKGQDAQVLSWQQRAATVKKLIDAGFARQVFLSNDWYFGIAIAGTGSMEVLEKRNPDGMLFTMRKTLPYLRQIGVAQQDIHLMTVENPRRFFGGA